MLEVIGIGDDFNDLVKQLQIQLHDKMRLKSIIKNLSNSHVN